MTEAATNTNPDLVPAHFDQPDWFKTAVFYEVLVRSFKDSNGDGVGDFRGLTEKLDYLHWLGVDCLWVPPFFSSPLRDGGYDVSDYTDILPEIGTVDDFHELLEEAHKRGIRVIIDFVMNHTSDQHPWFQASREDPDGPYGEGATLPAYYDAEEAVLVLRRPQAGIQRVDLLTCGTAEELDSVDLPAP